MRREVEDVMADRPILFSGPMVRAILEGRKSQTRRVISTAERKTRPNLFDGTWSDSYVLDPGNASWREQEYPWRVGDRLYVRETWKPHSIYAHLPPRDMPRAAVFYAADERYAPSNTPWKPGIHMPRWASRITLNVTDVRVQRLQEISDDDADAEVFGGDYPHRVLPELFPDADEAGRHSLPECFSRLWDSINAARGYGWETNPWVVAITFDAIRQNIDAGRSALTQGE